MTNQIDPGTGLVMTDAEVAALNGEAVVETEEVTHLEGSGTITPEGEIVSGLVEVTTEEAVQTIDNSAPEDTVQTA